jgi:hypothetical protein
MRNFLFSLFAISVAAVAAMTATTAMLNAPHRMGLAPETTANTPAAETPQSPAPDAKPATADKAPPATPGGTPDTAAKPANGAVAKGDTAADEDADKDPYEGIAPEELPPDLQYSADSSVSFPTNI